MEFGIFQFIGGSLDAMLNTFVTQTASNLILGFQLVMLTCVTLYFTLTGYAISTGAVENSFYTFLKQVIKISIIAAFCMTADNYAATVVSAIQGLETGLANVMATGTSTEDNIYAVLDQSMGTGLNIALDMMDKVSSRRGWEIGHMFWDLVNALLMAISVFIIHLPAAATIIMAKLGLGVLLGIGPLFIATLMFPITAPWFDKWFQQVMTYILEIAITMVVISVGLGIYKRLFDSVITTTTDHPMATFIEILATALIILYALKKTSGLGGQVAGGIAFGAVTFRGMMQGAGNVVNAPSTRRDMQSGMMATSGRLNHLAAGNSMFNPAYRQHVMSNFGKNWGSGKGGKVTGE